MYECLECGKSFKSTSAAERASDEGCPKCGGTDIDLKVSKVANRVRRVLDGAPSQREISHDFAMLTGQIR